MSIKRRLSVIILIALLIMVSIVGTSCKSNKQAEETGKYGIVIEVKDSKGETTSYEMKTDAEFLLQAMDELAAKDKGFSYSGEDSEYGLMVMYVNEERASFEEDGAYWALYVNGEYGMNGADTQPIADGDTYTWTYELAQ